MRRLLGRRVRHARSYYNLASADGIAFSVSADGAFVRVGSCAAMGARDGAGQADFTPNDGANESGAAASLGLSELSLRDFFPDRAAGVFVSGGVADANVDIPDFEERMIFIAGQMKWLVTLNSCMRDLYGEASSLSLHDAVSRAESRGLLSKKEAGILRVLNRGANEAKRKVD